LTAGRYTSSRFLTEFREARLRVLCLAAAIAAVCATASAAEADPDAVTTDLRAMEACEAAANARPLGRGEALACSAIYERLLAWYGGYRAYRIAREARDAPRPAARRPDASR
jgi:hypothetical protein